MHQFWEKVTSRELETPVGTPLILIETSLICRTQGTVTAGGRVGIEYIGRLEALRERGSGRANFRGLLMVKTASAVSNVATCGMSQSVVAFA